MIIDTGNREYIFDFLRTIAAFLVIVAHVAAFQFDGLIGSNSWIHACVYDTIAHVSVPLFFMISGRFLLDPQYQLTPHKLKKKIARLLLAYCVWSFVFVIRSNWGNLFNLHWVADNFHMMLGQFIAGDSHLWFIWALIGLYLITPILRQIVRDSSATRWFLLLVLLFQVVVPLLEQIPKVGIILNTINKMMEMKLVIGYSGFFVIGYYLYTQRLKRGHQIAACLIGLSCLAAVVVLTIQASSREGALVQDYFFFLYPLMIIASSSFYAAAIHWADRIQSICSSRMIMIASSYSFGIYLIHYSLVRILSAAGVLNWAPPILSIPVNALMIMTVSLLLAVLIRKIPYIGKQIT